MVFLVSSDNFSSLLRSWVSLLLMKSLLVSKLFYLNNVEIFNSSKLRQTLTLGTSIGLEVWNKAL